MVRERKRQTAGRGWLGAAANGERETTEEKEYQKEKKKKKIEVTVDEES